MTDDMLTPLDILEQALAVVRRGNVSAIAVQIVTTEKAQPVVLLDAGEPGVSTVRDLAALVGLMHIHATNAAEAVICESHSVDKPPVSIVDE